MRNLLTLHLSLIDGVGPATIARLQKQSPFEELYSCTESDIIRNFHMSPKSAAIIANGLKDFNSLEHEVELIQRNDIKWVTGEDAAYPSLLKEIDSPPAVLYYRGADLHTFDKNIAVVGSRLAGSYASEVVAAFTPSLIQFGWNIISGGAIGADTMAHDLALKNGGRTVAILGSGLLCPHPKSNKKLFEKIIQNGGSLVSSFKLMEGPFPGNFPARNRIIAGMSQACLVVQAAERSGASITAEFALNQGKHVFAVPGSIFDPLSAGCHALIKEGATPISSAKELLKELGENIALLTEGSEVSPNPATSFEEKVKKGTGIQNKEIFQAPQNNSIPDSILFYCKNPLSIEDLLGYVNIDMQELQDHLFDLQLSGQLEQNAVGLWQTL